MALMLDGREPARRIRAWVADSVAALKQKHGWTPSMVTVQIGENPAAERYVRGQLKACTDAGIDARLVRFPADISKENFLRELAQIDRDNNVDGIIVQTPLPEGWPADEILSAIPSSKDVEGVHPENLGRLYLGEKRIPFPCTAWSAVSLLEWYGRSSFEWNNCTIVGRSPNVGRAAALLLMHRQATITVCHTRTSPEQLRETLAGADVIIVATGVPGLIMPDLLPRRAWVVDIGINVTADGKLVGDVAPGAEKVVEAITPVPGGVGPMTVSLLLANLLLCATKRRLGESLTLDVRKLKKESQ